MVGLIGLLRRLVLRLACNRPDFVILLGDTKDLLGCDHQQPLIVSGTNSHPILFRDIPPSLWRQRGQHPSMVGPFAPTFPFLSLLSFPAPPFCVCMRGHCIAPFTPLFAVCILQSSGVFWIR